MKFVKRGPAKTSGSSQLFTLSSDIIHRLFYILYVQQDTDTQSPGLLRLADDNSNMPTGLALPELLKYVTAD
jgi:hypothetical protein